MKRGIRAALYPAPKRKNRIHKDKAAIRLKIDYKGIDFPKPVKQIDKLEEQNTNLAICGWEKDNVIVHRIGGKEKEVPRINLMLIVLGESQHYCYVKSSIRAKTENQSTIALCA